MQSSRLDSGCLLTVSPQPEDTIFRDPMPDTLTRYVCIALLLAVGACSGKFGHRLEERVQGRFTLPEGVTSIRVELVDGDVTFQAGAAGEIQFSGAVLKAADSAAQLAALEPVEGSLAQHGVEAGVFVLRGPRVPDGSVPDENRIALKIVVQVPADIPMDVEARAGNLAAIDLRASVALQVEHGLLHLKNVHGDGLLRTGTGDIVVDEHRGGLDAETRSGKVFAWVKELETEDVRLVTGDGPIQVRLPAEASFHLDAQVEMGKAANEYGVPVLRMGEQGAEMGGQVGEGGPSVVLRTPKGHISLRRFTAVGDSPLRLIGFGLLGILILVAGLFAFYRVQKKRFV